MKIEPFDFPEFDNTKTEKFVDNKKNKSVPNLGAIEEFEDHVIDPTISKIDNNEEKPTSEELVEQENNEQNITNEEEKSEKNNIANKKDEAVNYQEIYDKGFQEGYLKGKEEEKLEAEEINKQEEKELEQNIAKSISVIEKDIKDKIISHNNEINKLQEDTIKLAKAISDKLINKQLTKNALNIIDNVVNEIFPMLAEEPKIIIFVHKKIANKISQKLQDMINDVDYKGKLTIKSHEEDYISSCKIKWEGGVIEYNIDNINNKIEELLK